MGEAFRNQIVWMLISPFIFIAIGVVIAGVAPFVGHILGSMASGLGDHWRCRNQEQAPRKRR